MEFKEDNQVLFQETDTGAPIDFEKARMLFNHNAFLSSRNSDKEVRASEAKLLANIIRWVWLALFALILIFLGISLALICLGHTNHTEALKGVLDAGTKIILALIASLSILTTSLAIGLLRHFYTNPYAVKPEESKDYLGGINSIIETIGKALHAPK